MIVMDLQAPAVAILALALFTGILFSPSMAASEIADIEPSQPAAARNISTLLSGVEERLQGGRLLNFTPGQVADEPVENETPPPPVEEILEPVYDDDELDLLVEENGISLMLLSLQNT